MSNTYPGAPPTRVTSVLVLSCLTVLGDCVSAPSLPVVANDDDTDTAVSASVPERDLTMDDIRSELWQHERTIQFEVSTIEEREAVVAIVEALVRGAVAGDAPLAQLAGRANKVGLRLQVWRVDGQRYWALVEAEEDRRGAGAYIIRVGERPAKGPLVLLQAPHAFFDLGTGELALRLFFADHPRAVGLFTNTLHRYWDETGDFQKRERSPADVCHRTDHVFQHATDGATRALRDLLIVQLHGFADSKRRPDAIVSSGDIAESSPQVQRISLALQAVLGDVRRFPEEVDELGGTTNAQARLLRTSRRAHFVHLELSASARKKLQRKPELLARMADVLFGPAANASDNPAAINPGSLR